MKTKNLQIVGKLAFLALILAFSLAGFSKDAWSQWRMRDQVAQFQNFMAEHPSVWNDLRANPQLVYDKKYLDKHDDVKAYLKKRPDLKQVIAENPRLVFGRDYTGGRIYSGNRWDRRDDWRYDRWWDRDYGGYR